MFGALISNDRAIELTNMKLCKQTQLFKRVLALCGADGLAGNTGQEILHCLALEVWLETWNIEGLHAFIRRFVKTRSNQCCMLGILEASTEYILGKARTLGISSEAIEHPFIDF